MFRVLDAEGTIPDMWRMNKRESQEMLERVHEEQCKQRVVGHLIPLWIVEESDVESWHHGFLTMSFIDRPIGLD